GGGVIGDMAGFAAASFQRGVYFIQVPTTLLSQVDSSVGGKTGINHPLGKNMIGAFKQPQVVLADMAQLKTLPPRELSAGLAEVIKYALLGDVEFLTWLEQHIDALVAGDETLLAEAVYRSCAHKARIVANDEKEQGERALLNLGHTFGHAIESYLGYGVWLHGEAVATGMVMAADLSCRLGWLSEADVARTKNIIQRAKLPIKCPEIPLDEFLSFMSHDKKVLNGQLRLVLMRQLGQAIITKDFDVELMQQAILANQEKA
ncbi:3-dehydroquinate synthase, partial [Acinetobacter brisouii]|uniref:3-dehydroquinate synthase n=1 Tax=Acinetobacter brisouii TaxID=396323 RepID=UPI0005F7A17F